MFCETSFGWCNGCGFQVHIANEPSSAMLKCVHAHARYALGRPPRSFLNMISELGRLTFCFDPLYAFTCVAALFVLQVEKTTILANDRFELNMIT